MKTVIEMARKSRLDIYGLGCPHDQFIEAVERFAELVRADERERIYFQTSSDFVKAAIADEREACAKVCDDKGMFHEVSQGADLAFELATAIRARSNT